MNRILLAGVAVAALSASARAQSLGTTSNWYKGYVPSVAEWQGLMAAKGDLTATQATAATANNAMAAAAAAQKIAAGAIPTSMLGQPGGVAGLGPDGTISLNTLLPNSNARARTVAAQRGDLMYLADYGVRCDWVQLPGSLSAGGLTYAAGGTTVASSAYQFTASDVGKVMLGGTSISASGVFYRTILSVADGVATVDQPFTSASSSVSAMSFGTFQDGRIAAAMAQWASYQTAPPMIAPPGACALKSTWAETDLGNFVLLGAGEDKTQFLMFNSTGDGLHVDNSGGGSVTLRDFEVIKAPGANLGTQYVGSGVHIGGTGSNGNRVVVENVGSLSVYGGNGWAADFEQENGSFVRYSHTQANGTFNGFDTALADLILPGNGVATWGPSAAIDHGVCYYIHGDGIATIGNNPYITNSEFINPACVGGEHFMDLARFQGVNVIDPYDIDGDLGVREMALPADNGAGPTNEELSVIGGIIQNKYLDAYDFEDNLQMQGVFNWGFGQPGWTGAEIVGATQEVSLTGNTYFDAGKGDIGIYSCTAFAHSYSGNNFEAGDPSAIGVELCPTDSSGTITANASSPRMLPGRTVVNLGSPGADIVTGNTGGSTSDDGHGGILVGALIQGQNSSWESVVRGYFAVGAAGYMTPAGFMPLFTSGLTVNDAAAAHLAKGSTTLVVSNAAAWGVNMGISIPSAAHSSVASTAVVASVDPNTNTLSLASPGLTAAITNRAAATQIYLSGSTQATGTRIAPGVNADFASMSITNWHCDGGTVQNDNYRFTGHALAHFSAYALDPEGSTPLIDVSTILLPATTLTGQNASRAAPSGASTIQLSLNNVTAQIVRGWSLADTTRVGSVPSNDLVVATAVSGFTLTIYLASPLTGAVTRADSLTLASPRIPALPPNVVESIGRLKQSGMPFIEVSNNLTAPLRMSTSTTNNALFCAATVQFQQLAN